MDKNKENPKKKWDCKDKCPDCKEECISEHTTAGSKHKCKNNHTWVTWQKNQ